MIKVSDVTFPRVTSGARPPPGAPTNRAWGSVITSVVLNCAGWPFISQTMVGVGAPIEVQESLSDPPSSTDNRTAWFALVDALTAE